MKVEIEFRSSCSEWSDQISLDLGCGWTFKVEEDGGGNFTDISAEDKKKTEMVREVLLDLRCHIPGMDMKIGKIKKC